MCSQQVRQQFIEKLLLSLEHAGVLEPASEVVAFQRIGSIVVKFDGDGLLAKYGFVVAQVSVALF